MSSCAEKEFGMVRIGNLFLTSSYKEVKFFYVTQAIDFKGFDSHDLHPQGAQMQEMEILEAVETMVTTMTSGY